MLEVFLGEKPKCPLVVIIWAQDKVFPAMCLVPEGTAQFPKQLYF